MKNFMLPAREITLAREVEIHYKRPIFSSMVQISSPVDAEKHLRSLINELQLDYKEFFWVLLLNNANRLSAYAQIAIGSDKGVAFNIREVFQLILKANASAFIVAHNHPSGRLKVSQSDQEITQKLKASADQMGIEFLDHLILTSESYLSMRTEGILE